MFFNFLNVESIYSNKGLKRILKIHLKVKTFEELVLPLYVHCTKFNDGTSTWFNKGDLVQPILASCSAPPLFPPVMINGVEYTDGSMSGLGIKKAEDLGFKQIILVNLNSKIKQYVKRTIPSLFCTTLETCLYEMACYELAAVKKSKVIQINIDPKYGLDFTDFSTAKELIKLGEKRAKQVLHKINT